MKKFTTAILALLILSTSMGMTVEIHYCMGKAVAASLWQGDDAMDACTRCGMEKQAQTGCCQDEEKVIKTDSAKKTENTLLASFSYVLIPSSPKYHLEQSALPQTDKAQLSANESPGIGSVPLYIRNCLFRI